MAGVMPRLTAEEAVASAAEAPSYDPAGKVVDEDCKKLGAAIRDVACGPDMLVTGSSRNVVKVWKVAEGKVTETAKLKHGAVGSCCVEVSSDGSLVVVCSDDGSICLWDPRESKRVGDLAGDLMSAWKAKLLVDGQRLVSGGPSGSLCFWDLRQMQKEREIAPDISSLAKEDMDLIKRR